MKKNFIQYNLILFKIIIISNFIFYSLLLTCERDAPIIKDNHCVSTYCNEKQYKSGECVISNPIIKKKWLNDIMIFKNTNGEIYLSLNTNGEQLIFGTTSSNNEERLFYGLYNNEIKYMFGNDDNYAITINKTINILENKKPVNREMGIIIFGSQKYIILIGNDNSYIEMLNLKEYTNDFFLISPKEFLNKDIIIRGISMIVVNDNQLILGITTTNDDTSIYNFYIYKFSFLLSENNPNFSLLYSLNIGEIKGEYIDCQTTDNVKIFSCIFLNKDNNYIITLFENNQNNYFQIKNSFIIDSLFDSKEKKNYFLKGILYKE